MTGLLEKWLTDWLDEIPVDLADLAAEVSAERRPEAAVR